MACARSDFVIKHGIGRREALFGRNTKKRPFCWPVSGSVLYICIYRVYVERERDIRIWNIYRQKGEWWVWWREASVFRVGTGCAVLMQTGVGPSLGITRCQSCQVARMHNPLTRSTYYSVSLTRFIFTHTFSSLLFFYTYIYLVFSAPHPF